jgi:hypothetical protein
MFGLVKLGCGECGDAAAIEEAIMGDTGGLSQRDRHLCGTPARFSIEPKKKTSTDIKNDLLLWRIGKGGIDA